MDVPATCLTLALGDRDGTHGCGRTAFGRPPVALAAATSAGTTTALFVTMGASTIVLARLSSTFLFVARASFLAIAATTLTIPVAFPVTVATVRALAVGGVPLTILPFSPATVSVPPVPIPVSVSAIAPFAVAMVPTRRTMTLGVSVVVVRAVCKMGRRKEVSTILDGCWLVEGVLVYWQ